MNLHSKKLGLLFKFFVIILIADASHGEEVLPRIAVIANDLDPVSLMVADYYIKQRNLSENSIYKVSMDPGSSNIKPRDFIGIKTILELSIPDSVQFYLLTWSMPYRVGCMSITSAFALGFDKAYCSQFVCSPTAASPYYNSDSSMPYESFKIRPTMMLAYENYDDAKQLINRGVLADKTHPMGKAYLVSTNDKDRNVRAAKFHNIVEKFKTEFEIEVVKENYIKGKNDIFFYFTGLKKVPGITKNTFLPGAIADHLTSTGGILFNGKQMSAIRWLQAGATASYGTVVEPCNYPQKFPNPEIVMRRYLDGETLMEAYWKSVAWPGEGLFIGEPLSRPFAD